ncbi:MAG: sigma-70 family RNA polymerase sigma factor [Myxococcota bacterium]
MSANLPDGELLKAAKAGESWAQGALARRHLPMALRVAGRIMPASADREDIVQDAFVKAFSRLGSVREGDAFAGWLRAIVVRTALNRVRRRKLERTLGLQRSEAADLSQVVGHEADPLQRARLQEVYAILERVPAADRVAYVLRVIEGLTISEVAQATGSGTSTVKRRVRRVEAAVSALEHADG